MHLDILEKYKIIELVLIQNVSGFSEHLLYYPSIMLLHSYSHYLFPPISLFLLIFEPLLFVCVISHSSSTAQSPLFFCLQISTNFLAVIFASFSKTQGLNHSTQAYKGQCRPTAVPRACGMAWGVSHIKLLCSNSCSSALKTEPHLILMVEKRQGKETVLRLLVFTN